jgi:flagellar biosynthesis protein FliP
MKTLRLLAFALIALPAVAATQEPLSLLGVSTGKGAAGISMPMQVMISLTLLTLLPGAVMAMTPFLRITVVLREFSGSVRDSKSPILVSSVRRRGASDK